MNRAMILLQKQEQKTQTKIKGMNVYNNVYIASEHFTGSTKPEVTKRIDKKWFNT